MFQVRQKRAHVLKVVLSDHGRIKIEMPAIDLEAFEARPTAEVKRQFLGCHRMEQNDFVAVSAQEAKGPSQCIQVIKAIAQQYEQAATFNAAREVRQVGRERSFAVRLSRAHCFEQCLEVVWIRTRRNVTPQRIAEHCQSRRIALPQYEARQACSNGSRVVKL